MEISSNSFEFIPRIKNTFFFSDFSKISNKNNILLFGFTISFFILIFSFFGTNEITITSITFFIIEIFILLLIVYIIFVNFNNEYSYDTKIDNIFNNKLMKLDIKLKNNKKCKEPSNDNSEVFHIPNNLYTYEESRKVCSKYNSRLATYNEIENAYKNGATWCSYGWSEDQLALFPTQESVYNELKKTPGHENDCGRQGINGGYIDNKFIKFGVNCFGKKPKQTDEDKTYIEILKHSHSPAMDNSDLDKKDNNLIAPFNKEKWSII